jgi:hypothetical protein
MIQHFALVLVRISLNTLIISVSCLPPDSFPSQHLLQVADIARALVSFFNMANNLATDDRKNEDVKTLHHLERYPSISHGTMLGSDMDPPKTYKRRFIGMAQLFILNLCFTIAWIDLAPVVDSAAEHFGTSVPAINWFSTSFFLAALVANYPASFVARRGLKLSMIVSGALMVGGTWLMYGGTRIKSFSMALIGYCVIAVGQPFLLILAAPFLDAWF